MLKDCTCTNPLSKEISVFCSYLTSITSKRDVSGHMPKEKLWFTQEMHNLRSWACAFLSRLSGISQGSQLQRLKGQVNAASSTLITNQGNFHATNWYGKTFVPPQLLGKNYRPSGSPEAQKSAFIGWMLTTRKWEFPGIYGLIFFLLLLPFRQAL